MNEYESLREAIIVQAIKDWEALCNGAAEIKHRNFGELVMFFQSDCNEMLSGMGLSGKRILQKLMKMRGAPTWDSVRSLR